MERPGVRKGGNENSHAALRLKQIYQCGACGMLVHLMHAGTARECGSPECASDGLSRPSHRVRYMLRQLKAIERILEGRATLIAAPDARSDQQRVVWGTYARWWIIQEVIRLIRQM